MMKRYLSSAPIGLAVTFALLYAMHVLIDTGNDVFVVSKTSGMPLWPAPPREEIPPEPDHLPEPPDPPLLPPAQTAPVVPTGELSVYVPTAITDPEPGKGFSFQSAILSDGPLAHILIVQPEYPIKAVTQGLEGYVTVRFDVLADGTVANVVAVDSSHRLFETAAVRAAGRFRFKPKVVDGVPVATTGVSYRFRFEMEN